MRFLLAFSLFAFSLSAHAADANKIAETFFANYAYISDWTRFQEEQSKILSPNLLTHVEDQSGAHDYFTPAGYFASLGDWSKEFSTGPDFHVVIGSAEKGRVFVRVHGAIQLHDPIRGRHSLLDREHQWSEILHIDEQGRIYRLDVLMHLFQ